MRPQLPLFLDHRRHLRLLMQRARVQLRRRRLQFAHTANPAAALALAAAAAAALALAAAAAAAERRGHGGAQLGAGGRVLEHELAQRGQPGQGLAEGGHRLRPAPLLALALEPPRAARTW